MNSQWDDGKDQLNDENDHWNLYVNTDFYIYTCM